MYNGDAIGPFYSPLLHPAMVTQRKIVHIDMDAFYASVEQRDNPQYRGLPVIVGGSPEGRGVVAACSYEARAHGIHSAMPCARAIKLCPHAVFIRPRISHYREVSSEIMAIFMRFTDVIEPLSLDEAYLDVSSNSLSEPSATVVAEIIRKQIFDELQLTASAGVSYNKFIAKIASDINKPNGIMTIAPGEAEQFLFALPIRKFFGVGRITEKKMLAKGIRTGADLAKWDRASLVFHFGKTGDFLYDSVRGEDNRPVKISRIRKSLGSETTLANDIVDLYQINQILSEIAGKLEHAMQRKNLAASSLTLKIRYHDFSTISRSTTTKYPILAKTDIEFLLPPLLASTEAGSKKIRLLGLSLSKLAAKENIPKQLYLPFTRKNPL